MYGHSIIPASSTWVIAISSGRIVVGTPLIAADLGNGRSMYVALAEDDRGFELEPTERWSP
jgi:hypothetical protein